MSPCRLMECSTCVSWIPTRYHPCYAKAQLQPEGIRQPAALAVPSGFCAASACWPPWQPLMHNLLASPVSPYSETRAPSFMCYAGGWAKYPFPGAALWEEELSKHVCSRSFILALGLPTLPLLRSLSALPQTLYLLLLFPRQATGWRIPSML